jgi:hypothetical protein
MYQRAKQEFSKKEKKEKEENEQTKWLYR